MNGVDGKYLREKARLIRDDAIRAAEAKYAEHLNAIALVVGLAPIIDQFADPPATDPDDASYLGEIRLAIAEMEEPFTKSGVKKIVLRHNEYWTESELRTHLHNGFSYLERTGKILRSEEDNSDEYGEFLWRRSPDFSPFASALSGNSCGVVEPSSGKEWKSIKDLIGEMPESLKAAPHQVYRAISAGLPLPAPDGRIIVRKKQKKPPAPQSEYPTEYRRDNGRSVEQRSAKQLRQWSELATTLESRL